MFIPTLCHLALIDAAGIKQTNQRRNLGKLVSRTMSVYQEQTGQASSETIKIIMRHYGTLGQSGIKHTLTISISTEYNFVLEQNFRCRP